MSQKNLTSDLKGQERFSTWDSWGHSTTQGSDSCHGNLFWAIFDGTGMARGHHVRLEQSPFQVYMMITQGLVHSSQDLGSRGDLCRAGTTAECTVLSIQG